MSAIDGGDAIIDGYSDIAMRPSRDMMRVSAPGRVPFQKVYLLSSISSRSKGKATASNETYNAQTDCLTGQDRLPTAIEKVESEGTKEYMEVGFIIGAEPERFLATGKVRDASRDKDRELRGAVDRDPTTMRVVIPTTEYIRPSCKFYVACNPVNGRFSPKLTQVDKIYFYNEFWRDAGPMATIKDRRESVSRSCREHAAEIQEEQKPVQVGIAPDDKGDIFTANPTLVPKGDHMNALLHCQLAMFKMVKTDNCLQAMSDAIEEATGGTSYGPTTSTVGIHSFLDFKTELDEEKSQQVQRELLESAAIRLSSDEICALHKTLAQQDEPTRSILDSRTFVFFFRYLKETGENDFSEVSVKQALKITSVYRDCCPRLPVSPFVNTEADKDDGSISVDEFLHILTCIENALEGVEKTITKGNAATKAQHGGIKFQSIQELMAKAASVFDKGGFEGLVSQIWAVQAHMQGGVYEGSRRTLRRLVGYIKHMKALIGDSGKSKDGALDSVGQSKVAGKRKL